MKYHIILSFSLCFLLYSCKDVIPNKKIIGILPYKGIRSKDINSVQIVLEKTYQLKVVVLDEISLPQSAYTKIRSHRYRADSLIHIQSRNVPDSISIIIGLTHKDISTTKYDSKTKKIKEPQNIYKDWGIFGLGQVNGNSCIVSTNRLKKGVNTEIYYTRLNRIATHEIGHVLGLPHCPTPKCVMNDANESIKTIDKSTGELCQSCWQMLD